MTYLQILLKIKEMHPNKKMWIIQDPAYPDEWSMESIYEGINSEYRLRIEAEKHGNLENISRSWKLLPPRIEDDGCLMYTAINNKHDEWWCREPYGKKKPGIGNFLIAKIYVFNEFDDGYVKPREPYKKPPMWWKWKK